MAKWRYDSGNLRALVGRHRLTYGDLAELLNLTKQTIVTRMNGQSELTNKEIEKLCDKFGIEPNDFYNQIDG